MTVREQAALLGQEGYLIIEDGSLAIRGEITDVRNVFGRTDVLFAPHGAREVRAKGYKQASVWVDRSRVGGLKDNELDGTAWKQAA